MQTKDWDQYLDEAAAFAIAVRHELHRCPEPGNREYKTADIIERELVKLDLSPERVLPTGICAEIRGERTGEKKTIALRAEIDGLPIAENTDLFFSSENRGFMHACGHDVHIAVTLGTAMVLSKIKHLFNADIKLIFQPDEEKEGGAKAMVEKGVLLTNPEDGKKADMIIGLHVSPNLPAGTIGLKYGKVHAASITFRMRVTGKKSHGAEPQNGIDAITASAQIISAVQLILSRGISPIQSGLITFGTIRGGEARNILAEDVFLEGIVRGEDGALCALLAERFTETAVKTGEALGAAVEIECKDGYPALVNDDALVNHIRGAVKSYGGIKVREVDSHTMTVDDFSYYLQEIPGAYFFWAAATPIEKTVDFIRARLKQMKRAFERGLLFSCQRFLQRVNLASG